MSGHLADRSIDLAVAEDEACTDAKYSTLRGRQTSLEGF